ncbi:TPA: hypothetical protein QHO99_004019 [Klebsiella pneumoniae]|uniref:hypothetical protein n=1 Tax=Klebsiella pneumoniae TaxID=573 RepID=UPI0027FCC55B|nr:hypothetical protein [Klebsiella pneumoniae]MDV2805321.1 hypothetical protein [Klebsiella pneumoniae subsp. pneumoniae]HDT3142774.1 hypothetical protein [Klebsiella pneumoniae]
MTDITELAKAAEKYRSTLEAHRNNPRDGVALNAWDDATSKFMELVDNDELNIISGLLEALEKAKGMEAYWKTQCRGITDHCEELQARIAELESRTVKLPKRFCPEEYEGSLLWSETEVWNQAISACNGALRTAGIKVEDE